MRAYKTLHKTGVTNVVYTRNSYSLW